MPKPTSEIEDLSNRLGESVVRDWPAMRMACDLRCGLASRKDWETIMAEAPPSEVGQHWSFVRGPKMGGEARIWSRV